MWYFIRFNYYISYFSTVKSERTLYEGSHYFYIQQQDTDVRWQNVLETAIQKKLLNSYDGKDPSLLEFHEVLNISKLS